MKKKNIIILSLVVGMLTAIKLIWLSPNKSEKSSTGKGPTSNPIKVKVLVLATKNFAPSFEATGSVLALESVELRPEVSGKLEKINFKEGSQVQQGLLLAKLNDDDLQAAKKKLQVQQQLAADKTNRYAQLLETKGVTREEYELAKAQVALLAADMDELDARIAKTEIRAPFSGTIGLQLVSAGSMVNSSTVIASIQQTEKVKIDFMLPEQSATAIKVGQAIKFRLNHESTMRNARVLALESAVDAVTRSLKIRAMYDNSGKDVIPGAFVQVSNASLEGTPAILIPSQCIIPELKGKKVFVSKSGKAQPVKIVAGARTAREVQVLEGLNAGDTLVVSGIMSLKPNAPLQIIHCQNQ